MSEMNTYTVRVPWDELINQSVEMYWIIDFISLHSRAFNEFDKFLLCFGFLYAATVCFAMLKFEIWGKNWVDQVSIMMLADCLPPDHVENYYYIICLSEHMTITNTIISKPSDFSRRCLT